MEWPPISSAVEPTFWHTSSQSSCDVASAIGAPVGAARDATVSFVRVQRWFTYSSAVVERQCWRRPGAAVGRMRAASNGPRCVQARGAGRTSHLRQLRERVGKVATERHPHPEIPSRDLGSHRRGGGQSFRASRSRLWRRRLLHDVLSNRRGGVTRTTTYWRWYKATSTHTDTNTGSSSPACCSVYASSAARAYSTI